MPLQSIQFYMGMILIRFQFLINVNSISIISWVLLSISITISITKTDPYQYQYIINFSKFSLSISIPISILHFFLINISLSMHCATLLRSATGWQKEYATRKLRQNYTFCPQIFLLVTSRHQRWLGFQPYIPFFHIHLCTVGYEIFQDPKFEIDLFG